MMDEMDSVKYKESMEIEKYKNLLEGQYYRIKLPSATHEIESILNHLDVSLSEVSMCDVRIIQAMIIIKDWAKSNNDLQDV